jgi:hypothetical protein
MRTLVLVLALVWAVANAGLALLMIPNAFIAKTAQHEGLPAQAALLLGGLLVGLFAVALAWKCFALLTGRAEADR